MSGRPPSAYPLPPPPAGYPQGAYYGGYTLPATQPQSQPPQPQPGYGYGYNYGARPPQPSFTAGPAQGPQFSAASAPAPHFSPPQYAQPASAPYQSLYPPPPHFNAPAPAPPPPRPFDNHHRGAPRHSPPSRYNQPWQGVAAPPPPAQPPAHWGSGQPFRGSRGRGARPFTQDRIHFQKRKRDDSGPRDPRPPKRDRPFDNRSHHQEHKKTASVAPTVPSFGLDLPASLPPKPPAAVQQVNAKKRNKKKKKNALGLTPKGEDREDTDEDVDEEATALAKAGSGSALAFETAGGVVTLKSRDDVARWIAERKRRYPTQANIAAKATLAMMSKKSITAKAEDTRPNFNLGLDYLSGSETDDAPKASNGVKPGKATSDRSAKSASKDADRELALSTTSSPETSGSESDGPPDKESTKTVQPAPTVTRRNPTSKTEGVKKDRDRKTPSKPIYCKNWTTYGSCTWKNCKFLHELPGVKDAAQNERYAQKQQVLTRKNLYQRFLEKEQLQQKDQVLRFVKFLGERGRLDANDDGVKK